MPKYLLTILPFLLFGLGAEAQIIIVPQPARTSSDLDLGGESTDVDSSFFINKYSSPLDTGSSISQLSRRDAWARYLLINETHLITYTNYMAFMPTLTDSNEVNEVKALLESFSSNNSSEKNSIERISNSMNIKGRKKLYRIVFQQPDQSYQTEAGGPYFFYEANWASISLHLQHLRIELEKKIKEVKREQYEAIYGASIVPIEQWSASQQEQINKRIAQIPITATDQNELAIFYSKVAAEYIQLIQHYELLKQFQNFVQTSSSLDEQELYNWLLSNVVSMKLALELPMQQVIGSYIPLISETRCIDLILLLERVTAANNQLRQVPIFDNTPKNFQNTALNGLELLLK